MIDSRDIVLGRIFQIGDNVGPLDIVDIKWYFSLLIENRIEAFGKIEPVLITEEWLIKFGFEKHKKGYFHRQGFPFRIENEFIMILSFEDSFHGAVYDELTEMKYVHQLQNFFFCTMRKEIKL